jgi:hypothetical protein
MTAYVLFFEESFRVAIAVDINLRHSIENCRILAATLDASLEPREKQLRSVPLLHLMDKFVDREVASDGH